MEYSFEELEEQYKPLILKIMNTLHIYRDHDSFYQIGLVALWEASNRFDAEKGKFVTFAYATIKGRLLEHLTKETKFYTQHQGIELDESLSLVDLNTTLPFENEMIAHYCEGLSNNQRKWVQKKIIEDKRVVDIAKEEGVSAEAVKSWGKEALKKIRRKVDGDRSLAPPYIYN